MPWVGPASGASSPRSPGSISSLDLAREESRGEERERPFFPPPDEDTFPTEKAFLDSLVPVPLETIEPDDRECVFCETRYGMIPGSGPSIPEMPVRLRCNHVFGEQCARRHFGQRLIVEFHLHPLKFLPGTRGNVLISKLYRYAVHKDQDLGGFNLFKGLLQNLHDTRLLVCFFGP
ncbi:hypothetical protein COCMIDRAFT_106015 [Bipolaris oryzae ATCC 44560]|uniref:RING-type domain-containing protein n=1 Tax=Bipolaris oryzae ATCC 44560 TaxID=930090 RepID=W6YQ33_COCMI|nr:uncharacterized protein COCMIDRAFT_106015 [Bipolaris oryzae ATCC 44560]EUC41502.1 hypothetical protein COCMIDRAFT_106015 [Bipolaris oryzae ATCC 44560]